MKLKTVITVSRISYVLVILLFLIALIWRARLFYWLALGLIVLLAVFSLIFWRCPECGRSLGRDRCEYCRHCGRKLDL